MSELSELTEKFGSVSAELRAATGLLEASMAEGKAADAETREAIARLSGELGSVKAKMEDAEAREADRKTLDDAKAFLGSIRTPSMAALVGSGSKADLSTDAQWAKGALITALYQIRKGANPDEYAAGKAALEAIGLKREAAAAPMDSFGKATLGDTGATGGYVLPNNVVDQVVKPRTQAAVYTGGNLLTVRGGVAVRGVDLPYRTGAPARMQTKQWGVAKENVDEAYGSYTATLLTIARIYDVGKQYLRFSAGSAEQDVIDELTKAAALGENYYVMLGDGTTGTGGEPFGIIPAITASAATYTSTFSPVASTVAGSAAAGFAKMAGALAARSRTAEAIVMNAQDYWSLFAQGSDNAGYFMSALLGAGFTQENGELRWQGVPVYHDANLTSKSAVMGEWSAAKFFRGLEFRIESSDQAGSRWDDNLVGFRGEEEIGFNANTAVAVGAFQLCTTIVP